MSDPKALPLSDPLFAPRGGDQRMVDVEKRLDILQKARMADAAHLKALSERVAALEATRQTRRRRRKV